MIKKVFTVLLGLLVAGTMISVDCSDAAVKRNRVRPRTVSKPVTQPAPTATQQTTAAPAAAATATAPKTTTTAPAATATQPTTAQGMPYGQTMAPGQTMAAPQSQGSGMGSALLGVGAGLAGGYLLNTALCPALMPPPLPLLRLPKEGSPPWLLPRLLRLLRPRLWRTCWATTRPTTVPSSRRAMLTSCSSVLPLRLQLRRLSASVWPCPLG